jgi:hypothetical protein
MTVRMLRRYTQNTPAAQLPSLPNWSNVRAGLEYRMEYKNSSPLPQQIVGLKNIWLCNTPRRNVHSSPLVSSCSMNKFQSPVLSRSMWRAQCGMLLRAQKRLFLGTTCRFFFSKSLHRGSGLSGILLMTFSSYFTAVAIRSSFSARKD